MLVRPVFRCSQCPYSFEYETVLEMIRRVDEHYEREHGDPEIPGKLARARCPHCRSRTFVAESAEVANRLLDEHMEREHGGSRAQEVMRYSEYDRSFLRQMRISAE